MEKRHLSETIAAIGSGLTASGIGIIRISGPEAFEIADRVARLKCGKRIQDMPSHTIRYGVVTAAGAGAAKGAAANEASSEKAASEAVIDEALFMIMRGPGTYTAEDTVEINCHGGPAVMRKVLQAVLRAGARLAEPGEFTKRAFLNGRIDLSEAEAVMDVIAATNDDALAGAVKVLRGSVRREIKELRSLLLTHIARIEASLDDPEHLGFEDEESSDFTDNYLEPEKMNSAVYREALRRDVTAVYERLERLIAYYEEGRLIREGIRTVILGRPNAGKSSLYNLLAGEERAIVTDIAGTTRDTLEELVVIGGMTLILTDTAGIRQTEEVVEKIGVERAVRAADEADLIIFVADASDDADENDREILDLLKKAESQKKIALLNKSDLTDAAALFPMKEAFIHQTGDLFDKILLFSATEGFGYEELGETIRDLFMSGKLTYNEEVILASERQRQAVIEAQRALTLVSSSLDQRMPEDFYAIDLVDAYAALGRVVGEEVGEDVINEVFARFCMGK